MKLTDAWIFLLPSGWARFPAGAGRERERDEAIEQVVARVIPAELPRDRAEPFRRMTRERLRSSIQGTDDVGANVVYLPVEPMQGTLVPASIVEIEFTSDPGADPLQVVSRVLADGYDDAEILDVDGRPAVRVSTTTTGIEQGGGLPPLSSQLVVYVISRNEQEGAWLALAFTVVANSPHSERLAEALVLFFDAIMTTFRWAGDEPDAAAGAPAAAASTPA